MKASTTLIFAGVALLFLAMCYSIAPALVFACQTSRFGIGFSQSYTFLQPDIFACNYWFCEILGVILLMLGLVKLWNEK
jgi:hypothetical protein